MLRQILTVAAILVATNTSAANTSVMITPNAFSISNSNSHGSFSGGAVVQSDPRRHQAPQYQVQRQPEHYHHHGHHSGWRPQQQVFITPAPVMVQPRVPHYYGGGYRPQVIQDLYAMCNDPRTTQVCGWVDGQNVCISCN